MGAQHSTTRTVQLENDAPVGVVIDVSDDVVQRLKGLHAKARQEQRERDKELAEANAVAAANQPSSYSNPPLAPSVVFYGEPTLTALDVRRQKEEELRKNDAYWENRLKQQELNLHRTNVILEKEYNDTFSAVRQRFENTPVHQQIVPCKEAKTKLLECYKANVGQTLNCSSLVTEFTSCIQEHRTKILNEKYQPGKPAAVATL